MLSAKIRRWPAGEDCLNWLVHYRETGPLSSILNRSVHREQACVHLKSDAFTKACVRRNAADAPHILDKFRTKHGGKMVRTLERRHIVSMLEKKKPGAQIGSKNYRADDPTTAVNAQQGRVKAHAAHSVTGRDGHCLSNQRRWPAAAAGPRH